MSKLHQRRRVTHRTSSTGVSPVVQSGAAEANPQHVIDQMMRRGTALPSGSREPMFGDFTSPAFYDYHFYLDQAREVQESFQTLPARIRDHFHNDPSALAEALDDPSRQKEMAALGFKESPFKTPPEGGVPTPKPDPESDPHKTAPEGA